LLSLPTGVIDVMTATGGTKEKQMTTFLIDAENSITALDSQHADFEGEIFASQQELTDLTAKWPASRSDREFRASRRRRAGLQRRLSSQTPSHRSAGQDPRRFSCFWALETHRLDYQACHQMAGLAPQGR